MRPQRVRVTAAGFSTWVFLDHRKRNFKAALAFIVSSGASLTGKVQHTLDPIREPTYVSLTRSTTTVTLTKTNHGLTAGDYIYVEGAGAPFDGEFEVATVASSSTITYTVANSGLTASTGRATLCRVFDHDLMTSMTSNTDGNYDFPPQACRLNLTSFSSGYADLVVMQGG